MPEPAPTISVVVATHDRPALVDRCLGALAAQTRPPDEVIVVDDASTTPVRDVVARHAARIPVKVLRRERTGGPGPARNEGWQAAGGDYVAFTDDDCRPAADWLERAETVLSPGTVVVGATLPDPEDGPMTSVFDRSMRVTEDIDARRFSTCNIVYPARVLRQLGGFNEELAFYGEDTDLGLRAMELGVTLRFQADAVVYHAVLRLGPGAALRERWRVGGIVRLVKLHPNVRRDLWDGLFWSRQHRLALLGAGAAPFLRFSPVAGFLAMPWYELAQARLNQHLGERAGTGLRRLPHLAGLLAIDIVEIGACSVASVREGTLFL